MSERWTVRWQPSAPVASDGAGSAGGGTDEQLVAEGRRVVRLEAAAVSALEARLDRSFVRACRLVHGASGRVIVSGIGKSGHIARKIAGTLTSTGTPATFLHPVEGLHGDLGIVGRDDVAILVSKSGNTSELEGLIEYLLRLGVPIVAMTGQPGGALSRHANVTLDCSVEEEACPMDLAPTASTTAALAMGDALAVVVLQLRGFREQDFAALHPGGALGRKLSVRVADVMVAEDYPRLQEDALMRDCIVPLAEMRGTVPIVDGKRHVVGVVTAGDLTRLMEREPDFLDCRVSDVMTRDPKVASPLELGSAAVRRMEKHGVMALPVREEDGRLVGIVHLHDLMKSGVL
ncbi:MAG: KpsF/GutQ family sugar-phosphate isomerase [Gemmatimonadota bacterium]